MIVCLVLLYISQNAWSSDVDRVVVNTNRGPISGSKGDGEFTTFFGIPYAKVDERNPFGNSLDQPHFDTPYDASDSSIKCPQVVRNEGGILQCLTLNIYVPTMSNTNQTIPIMVWFYGGGFVMGSANDYGGKYLIKHNIIVVTVNYRLGPYGFLCLDNSAVPGNQGLKDQVTALRWVKDNIGAFGGDANKVTIAGQSYGGGSVDLHLHSMYEKLFDKAIVQSGSMFTEGIFVKGDHRAAKKLSNQLGHKTAHTKNALKHLSKADPLQVMRAARNLSLQLRPCKEKSFKGVQSFFSHNPFHTQVSTKIKNVAIMIGYNSKEDFANFVNKPDEYYASLSNVFYEKLENTFVLRRHKLESLSKIVRAFYLGGKSISQEAMLELSDFMSDIKLNHAVEMSVNNYIKQGAGNVYKYVYSYVGGNPYKNISGVGAYHTEELQYLFEMTSVLNSDEQIMVRNRMTEMWANFVKYGDPTPEVTELLPTKWVPVINGTARPYLNIDVKLAMLDHVYHERMAFWDLIWHHHWRKSVVLEKKRHKKD